MAPFPTSLAQPPRDPGPGMRNPPAGMPMFMIDEYRDYTSLPEPERPFFSLSSVSNVDLPVGYCKHTNQSATLVALREMRLTDCHCRPYPCLQSLVSLSCMEPREFRYAKQSGKAFPRHDPPPFSGKKIVTGDYNTSSRGPDTIRNIASIN